METFLGWLGPVTVVFGVLLGGASLIWYIRIERSLRKARKPPPGEPAGMSRSLQQQSRPYRVDVWMPLLYPPGALVEVRDPTTEWSVTVVI